MRPLQARLVTLCQQVLALGVVLAVITPAAGLVSLDIVKESPAGPAGSGTLPAQLTSATVPTKPVEPEVTEVALTPEEAPSSARKGGQELGRESADVLPGAEAGSLTEHRVVSTPQPVAGFGAVGVTWASGEELEEDEITVRVRTRDDGVWGEWQELEYHDEHGPDPDSPEAATARPGTEPMFVGEVEDVQVEALTDEVTLPEDMSLAVIAPGESAGTATEAPEAAAPQAADPQAADGASDDDAMVLQASRRAVAQPTIYSRAQWGADESIRHKSSLRYGTISAGFVHHTVNANNYSEAEVPGIIRSIYAYHVKSRGWSDVGYNFLVDRFGRIWEGRYGGVDKPVVGAHTLGYNDYAFAMSAIGNFETVRPTDAMLRAYGSLFAWKLSLHGVDPMSKSQRVGRSTFKAINGHRDAGSTACPGQYLYNKLGKIRRLASEGVSTQPTEPTGPAPVTVGEPDMQTSLVGTAHPDLVVRRATDGRAFVLPTGGLTKFSARKTLGEKGWDRRSSVFVAPDVTGDGVPDLLWGNRKGIVRVRPGTTNGTFGRSVKKVRTTRRHSLLTGIGDVNGDGRGDLVGRYKGRMVVFHGTTRGGFTRDRLGKVKAGSYVQLVGVGDITGDGRPDVVARSAQRAFVLPGNAKGIFRKKQVLSGLGGYRHFVGGGDYTGDGRADLVAQDRRGAIFVLPGLGNGSFGAALGPAANLNGLKRLSGAGQIFGSPAGDLVGVNRKGALLAVANKGTFELGAVIDTGVSLAGMNRIINAGDVDQDGLGDVVTTSPDGGLWLYRGNGQGQLAAGTKLGGGFQVVDGLRSWGDVTGDGRPDLVGTMNGALTVWAGTGTGYGKPAPVAGRLQTSAGLPADLSRFDWVVPVSSMQLKGRDDYVVREAATGRLWFYNGRSSGVGRPRLLGEGLGGYDLAG